MSGPVDPRQMYEALRHFHEMEKEQSASANIVMAEMMNWLLKRIEANSEFLSMFGHLVPRPMPVAAQEATPVTHGPPHVPQQDTYDWMAPAPASNSDEEFERKINDFRRRAGLPSQG